MNLIETLKASPLFTRVKPLHLERLAQSARVQTYLPDDVIIAEGTEGHAFYILVSGEAEVVKSVGSLKEVVATLGPGKCFGEAALMLRRKRTATVRAIEETKCVSVDRSDFISVMRSAPDLAISLLAIVFERLDAAQSQANVAVESLDLRALADQEDAEAVDIDSLIADVG